MRDKLDHYKQGPGNGGIMSDIRVYGKWTDEQRKQFLLLRCQELRELHFLNGEHKEILTNREKARMDYLIKQEKNNLIQLQTKENKGTLSNHEKLFLKLLRNQTSMCHREWIAKKEDPYTQLDSEELVNETKNY